MQLFSRLVLTGSILGAGLGGFYLLNQTKPTIEPLPVSAPSWRVSATTIALRPENPEFRGFATVENPQQQVITAPLSTRVVEVYVANGSRVEANQPLLLLNRPDAEAQLNQALASLADIRSQLNQRTMTETKDRAALQLDREALALLEAKRDRLIDLRSRGLASDEQLETARQAVVGQQLQINRRELTLANSQETQTTLLAQLTRIESDVRLAREDLDAMQPSATVGGVIAELTVTPGDRINANQALMRLIPDNGYELRIAVPQPVADRIQTALKANQPIEGQTLNGDLIQVERIAGLVNARTGAVDLYARISQPAQQPVLGAITNVRIMLPALPEIAAVPTDALYGGNTIYRIRDNQLEALEVTTYGQREAERGTEILLTSPALQSGDQILISRLPAAITGLLVEVVE